MSPVKCRCQTAASSMTTKWDTASVQAQCCAMYGMRNLPPLLTPTPSPSTRPFARHISIHIYLSCSPQSSCCSAFGHSCIFGLPLSEHILAQTGASRAATRIQYHACLLLSRVVVDVHFVTPSLSLRFPILGSLRARQAGTSKTLLPSASSTPKPQTRGLASPPLASPAYCSVPALCEAAPVWA